MRLSPALVTYGGGHVLRLEGWHIDWYVTGAALAVTQLLAFVPTSQGNSPSLAAPMEGWYLTTTQVTSISPSRVR
jgi:hypothetical protein